MDAGGEVRIFFFLRAGWGSMLYVFMGGKFNFTIVLAYMFRKIKSKIYYVLGLNYNFIMYQLKIFQSKWGKTLTCPFFHPGECQL